MAVEKCLVAIDAQKTEISELEGGAFSQGTDDWALICKNLVPLVRKAAHGVQNGVAVRSQSRNVSANRLQDVSDAEMGLAASAWGACESVIHK